MPRINGYRLAQRNHDTSEKKSGGKRDFGLTLHFVVADSKLVFGVLFKLIKALAD